MVERVGIVAAIVALTAVLVAVNSALVWWVWNFAGVHRTFHAPPMNFSQCVTLVDQLDPERPPFGIVPPAPPTAAGVYAAFAE